MTSAFSWQNSVSLWPALFCTPRLNLPVTPGIFWLPTFTFQSCDQCWVFQICWHIECSTFTASSFRIWKPNMKSSLQSAKTRLGADCGSDHEHLIAKFRLKLKKVGKTTRRFRYDLNQIPYNYTVEVTNRFKGLDLIDCLKNYGQRFMTLYRRQWSKPSPRKRNANRQNGCLRRPYK